MSVPATTGHAIVLCESAIDALSCHALHPDCRCLSTAGARPDPAWLPALIAQDFPIYCGFDADPVGDATCFILAVMLERKRLLKVKTQSSHEHQRTLVYEHAKSGEVFTIEDPNLRLDQLADVQHMVAHLLEHGLDPASHPSVPNGSASTGADPAASAAGDGEAPTGGPLSAEAAAEDTGTLPPDAAQAPPEVPTETPEISPAERLIETEASAPPV